MINMLLNDINAGKTDVSWEIAPMPIPDVVEPGTTWGQFQFAGITSTTKHPEESFDFLKYLCGPEGAAIYASTGMVHAYTDEGAEAAYKEAVGKDSVSVIFNAKRSRNLRHPATLTRFLISTRKMPSFTCWEKKALRKLWISFCSRERI